MRFCRTRLSAKRFIAGVGGHVPWPLTTAAPSKGGPPAPPPSLRLPMIRSATLHTASIAPRRVAYFAVAARLLKSTSDAAAR